MQAKFDELVEIAEAENKEKPFRILMVGDSTMKHQFGSMCGFLGEREGHRFNSAVRGEHRGSDPVPSPSDQLHDARCGG